MNCHNDLDLEKSKSIFLPDTLAPDDTARTRPGYKMFSLGFAQKFYFKIPKLFPADQYKTVTGISPKFQLSYTHNLDTLKVLVLWCTNWTRTGSVMYFVFAFIIHQFKVIRTHKSQLCSVWKLSLGHPPTNIFARLGNSVSWILYVPFIFKNTSLLLQLQVIYVHTRT